LKQAFGSGNPQTRPAAVRTRETRAPGPWSGALSRDVTSCLPVPLGLHHAPISSTGALGGVQFRFEVVSDDFGELKNLAAHGDQAAASDPLTRMGLPCRRVGRALVSSASLYINCEMDYGRVFGFGSLATKESFGRFRVRKSADCEGLT